ncbi:MAG: hypothetical protein GY743_08745 [Planctomycetaceae bacterium]|nr:hypothetical protein [Planctomycetaceae bacterium]
MIDCGFPVIKYAAQHGHREWGRGHGEQFRDAIQELVEIRKNLMSEKNPDLSADVIQRLAERQFVVTVERYPALGEEFLGMVEGADVSVEDLVILNNYTDFRDIPMPDEGCSVAYVSHGCNPVVGQTWDMHGSAKRYVCCLEVPCAGFDSPAVFFSLVGCLGMMGFHPDGRMVGVNNINTDKADAGLIWPALIRSLLMESSHQAMDQQLETAPVTSGHAYLLASPEAGEFWEVLPGLAERIERLEAQQDGFLFHTNHCLGNQAKLRESTIGKNSTTYIRYDLLQKKIGEVKSLEQMYSLMNDHENYPKSICSNFQTDTQDPSVTCGGAVGELKTGEIVMWRGDEQYDDTFVSHKFKLGDGHGA